MRAVLADCQPQPDGGGCNKQPDQLQIHVLSLEGRIIIKYALFLGNDKAGGGMAGCCVDRHLYYSAVCCQPRINGRVGEDRE